MKIVRQQLIFAVTLFPTCVLGIVNNSPGAETPQAPKERSASVQPEGSQTQKVELPEGVDDIIDALWPPMPMKRRVFPIKPVIGGLVVDGLQLIAQPEKYEVEVLEPIVLHITVRNTSDKDLQFGTTITKKIL